SELAHLQYKKINDYNSALINLKTTIDIIESFPRWIIQLFFWDDFLLYAELQDNHLHNYDEAQKNYWKAINYSTKNMYKLSQIYNNLALCYDKQKKYDDAIKSVTTAIEIATNLKEKDSKYLTRWLDYRHSMSEIKINNGKDLEEVKANLLEMKSIAQNNLNENPNNEEAKKNITDIDTLLSKLNQ
nr:tetratricopeptide repeat protein [Bacteroidales bacterium]